MTTCFGPPDLAFETASSRADRDLGPKLSVYRRSGVREYILWYEDENRIDWFELLHGEYQLRLPDGAGRIESTAFPGLVLDLEAALNLDVAAVIAAL